MESPTTPRFFTNLGEFTAALDAGTAPSGSALVSTCPDQRVESVFIGTHSTHWCAHRRHDESIAEFAGKIIELSVRFHEVTRGFFP